jgi:hypothetical protein
VAGATGFGFGFALGGGGGVGVGVGAVTGRLLCARGEQRDDGSDDACAKK